MLPVGTVIELPNPSNPSWHKFIVLAPPHPGPPEEWAGRQLLANFTSVKSNWQHQDRTVVVTPNEWKGLSVPSCIDYGHMLIAREAALANAIQVGSARLFHLQFPPSLIPRIQRGVRESPMSQGKLIRFLDECLKARNPPPL